MDITKAIEVFLEHRTDQVEPSSLKTYEFWLRRWHTWRQKRRLPAGAADLELQQLLGHASIISTTRYTRKDPERLHKIYSRADLLS